MRGEELYPARLRFAVIDLATSDLKGRLAQFCAVKLDNNFSEISTINYYVRPEGWKMHPRASQRNGLTDRLLNDIGTDIRLPIASYIQLIDEGYTVVAYNAAFDMGVMHEEIKRINIPMPHIRFICLMKVMKNICRIPRESILTEDDPYKYPSMQEALAHFEIPFTLKTHTDEQEVRKSVALLKKLASMRLLGSAKIKYSRD
jgi:DNA polymerase III epsilon subunit-like protein